MTDKYQRALAQKDQQIRLVSIEQDALLTVGDLVDDNGEWKIVKVFENEDAELLYEILATFSPNRIQPLFNISLP